MTDRPERAMTAQLGHPLLGRVLPLGLLILAGLLALAQLLGFRELTGRNDLQDLVEMHRILRRNHLLSLAAVACGLSAVGLLVCFAPRSPLRQLEPWRFWLVSGALSAIGAATLWGGASLFAVAKTFDADAARLGASAALIAVLGLATFAGAAWLLLQLARATRDPGAPPERS
jgi:hypothetical protein